MYDTFKDPLLQEFLRRRENLGTGSVPHMSKTHLGGEKRVARFIPLLDETKPSSGIGASIGIALLAIVSTLFIQGRNK